MKDRELLPYDSELEKTELDLDYLLRNWKGNTSRSNLKNLHVLDLASGSEQSRYIFTTWIPYFSRICNHHGAHVLAIDIQPQTKTEKFPWIQQDLVNVVLNRGLQNLPILERTRFDIIHSSNFVGMNYCPRLLSQLTYLGISMDEFEVRLIHQSGILLKEGGVMTLDIPNPFSSNPILYTKTQGSIVDLKIN